MNAEQGQENKRTYTELYESPEYLFCVQYEVQVSEVPATGLHYSAFIRDMDKTVKTGPDGLPLACITKHSNTYDIATHFCIKYTQTTSFEKFLARFQNAIRSIYAVALFLRQVVKTYGNRQLTREDCDAMRTKFGYLIADHSILPRFEKVEAIPKKWPELQEIMGPAVLLTED
jgi:hypothetical protein